MKAIWNGQVLAESNETIPLEGNQYFPLDSVNKAFLKESETHSFCPWKGQASYYTIEVNGEANTDAAWYYPDPKPAADKIKGYVAFWGGVEVTN